MTIEQRPNGYYRATVMINGKRYRGSGHSKEEAIQKLKEVAPYIEKKKVPIEPRQHATYVYLMQNMNNGRLKIGVSDNPERRKEVFITGSGDEIKVLLTSKFNNLTDAIKMEHDLHSLFAEYRIYVSKRSTEWFLPESKPYIEKVFKEVINDWA